MKTRLKLFILLMLAFTINVNSQSMAYDELFVNDFIKVGTSSLYLSSTNAGVDNSIYTTSGDLRINAAEGQGSQFNTLINPNNGNIGIGMFEPAGKLDINLGGSFHTKEIGVRITVPDVVLQGGPNDNSNESIFEIRKDISGNLPALYNTQFILNHTGNIGVGIKDPNSKLHVHDGRIQITGQNSYGGPMVIFGGDEVSPNGQWGIEYMSGGVSGLNFWKPDGSNDGSGGNGIGNHFMFLTDDGKVSIGLDPNFINSDGKTTYEGDYRLYVATGILTEKVKVALRLSEDWADYVFEEDYPLLSLKDVEKHINEKGHLPNVPSAEEVVQSGIDVAKMDSKLLEKIEELTLYLIEQDKRLEKQENRIEELTNQLKKQ